MKNSLSFFVIFSGILLSSFVHSQQLVRQEIHFPDIRGYQTLKCDFHVHTVFSDGLVWPEVRIYEAFREGLDAIAVTDHLEYHPHSAFVDTNGNRAHELMKEKANELSILLIPGTEVTRKMPPGHLNALFVTDPDAAQDPDYFTTLKGLSGQGAFIFWNHPGWIAQAREGIRWYDVHTMLVDSNLIQGIEVVNYGEWYPEALEWCVDKNLTVFCDSDIHEPAEIYREYAGVSHRPVTLVFADGCSVESIHEALLAGRTAGWFEDTLVGLEQWLRPLVEQSIHLGESYYQDKDDCYFKLTNSSPVNYSLRLAEVTEEPTPPEHIRLPAGSTVIVKVPLALKGSVPIAYEVENAFIRGRENLRVDLSF